MSRVKKLELSNVTLDELRERIIAPSIYHADMEDVFNILRKYGESEHQSATEDEGDDWHLTEWSIYSYTCPLTKEKAFFKLEEIIPRTENHSHGGYNVKFVKAVPSIKYIEVDENGIEFNY